MSRTRSYRAVVRLGHPTDNRKVRRLFETLDEKFGEHLHLPDGMMTGRADHIDTCWRWRIACHDRDERAGCHVFIGETIGKISDAESGDGGGNERGAVVG